jgi:hypothetical protein
MPLDLFVLYQKSFEGRKVWGRTPQESATLLVQHLKSHHDDLHKKYLALKEAKPKEKQWGG